MISRILYIVIFLQLSFLLKLFAQPQFIRIDMPDGPTQVYSLFELEAEVSTVAENYFDYDQAWLKATITSPEGVETNIDGFYYQHFTRSETFELVAEGLPFYKLRYTPHETGTHFIQLQFTDQQGTVFTEQQSFLVVDSNKKGFVRKVDGNQYLKDDQGKTVFLIGQNLAWAGFESGTDQMHQYMQRLHDHGGNFAKLMLVPWSYKFEWVEGGLRNYQPRQDRAFMMDSIFSMASGYNMYMQLAFAIHNELRFGYPAEDWTSNPYNQDNGGPCASPLEFFTHPQAKAAFKNKIRYIIARWAYEPKLVAWEVMSEADNFPFYKPNSATIAAWINEMASFIKAIDPYGHLVSVGFALLESNPMVWNNESIDFTQTHFYKKEADLEGHLVRQNQLYLKQFQKPMLTGEFDLGHHHDSLIQWDPEGLALHNTFWASSLSGAFGAAVPWFWDNYIDQLNLYYRYSGIAAFMANENLADGVYDPVHLSVVTSQRNDMPIEPGYFDLSAKPPSNLFRLQPTGLMIPGADSLGVMLYGPNSVFQVLRNPPIFSGYWHEPALMTIETGSQVFNSRLQVKLNDNVLFEQNVQAGTIYTIEIPAGNNNIRLDNTGTAFTSALEINQIIFSNYLHQLRAFGLHATDKSLVWLHNRDHHWDYLAQNGHVPDPVSGQLILPFYSGQYEVAWYNTLSGSLDSASTHTASNQGLLLDVAPLSTDLALKATMVSHADYAYGTNKRVVVFPNPSDKGFIFVLEEQQPVQIFLEIFDITGRRIHYQQFDFNAASQKKLEWKGTDKSDRPISRGMYFYRLRSSGETYTGKLVRN